MYQIHICINLRSKKKGDTYRKRITLSFCLNLDGNGVINPLRWLCF